MNEQITKPKVTKSGIMIKTVILLIITFISMFFALTQIGPFLVGWMGLILSVVLGIVFYILYKTLSTTENSFTALIISLINSILVGLLAGNSLWVIIIYGGLFMDISYELVVSTIGLALLATSIVVVGGIIVFPFLKANTKGIGKLFTILMIMLLGYSILYSIGFIFALIGFEGLWNLLVTIIYGNGIISIILSLIFVLISTLIYLKTLMIAKGFIGNQNKIKEYFIASMLVNAIINIFIDMFRLILKLRS